MGLQHKIFTLLQTSRYYNNVDRYGITMSIAVLHPKSRGSITLASGDPLDRPLIDPKLLTDPKDIEVAKAGQL